MAAKKRRSRLFETRYFGFVIAAGIICVLLLCGRLTRIPDWLEMKVLDMHFGLKDSTDMRQIREGVTRKDQNPDISPDITILGIDFNSLNAFGRWPFPRYRHANLLDALSHIQNQDDRENAVFIDIFFVEPDTREALNDALLSESIRNNGRVFLETVLDLFPPPAGAEDELFGRQETLYQTLGSLRVKGDWEKMRPFYGVQPPLVPYGKAGRGYGHANYLEDYDKIYRRQPLVARSSRLIETLKLDELTSGYTLDRENYEWLCWTDRRGIDHVVEYPVSEKVLSNLRTRMGKYAAPREEDTNQDGTPDVSYYSVRKYRDHFTPAITLSLALNYFGKTLNDAEVVLGSHIRIPAPQYFDTKTQEWIPYRVPGGEADLQEISIPINENGEMLVNFMGGPSSADAGGYKTFPVYSYATYASRVPGSDPSKWPRTWTLRNKILMVGSFTQGMAADEKPTPFGLMYGVEIHANALNTILMNKFLTYAPWWINTLILCALAFAMAFLSSRFSPLWSGVIAILAVCAYFFLTTMVFDKYAFILNFSQPAIALVVIFVVIVVYRTMTEEKDKRRIREMFGKYVSPAVVDEILRSPQIELGGVDKDLTVFFSDIRGFTTMSESMTPQELVNHLNVYLTAMTDIILEYRGTLDKYVGDEVMCFWGAPLPQEDHAILACKCALKQMKVLGELNASWPDEKRINIGIGINSGIMTVGNMGSLGRMNYTLMGDNVNLGARLEGTNKAYATNIILSEYTHGLVKDKVIARELDNIKVKGKNKPVVIYELIDVLGGLDVPKPAENEAKH
ncbi:MAG: adenylate/guanylate cyclase domain-containing protein [Spirochaetales bacterium]|jgi:adenylate cyclase|nr:adenylate/guanylate cyclase domain-containing protein [Spirochaetales bacterium]